MIRLSNTLKRLMKVGAILFGLAFIIAGVIGIRQDDTFLPTKAVMEISFLYAIPHTAVLDRFFLSVTKIGSDKPKTCVGGNDLLQFLYLQQ